MARTDNLTHFLTDVASAIKTKKGSQDSILASNFDTEIANLPSGGGIQIVTITFVAKDADGNILGQENIENVQLVYDDGYDVWEKNSTFLTTHAFSNLRYDFTIAAYKDDEETGETLYAEGSAYNRLITGDTTIEIQLGQWRQ